MNFNQIKVEMDDAVSYVRIPSNIVSLPNRPTIVQRLRTRMTYEMIAITLCYLLLLLAPFLYKIEEIPKNIYQLLLFFSAVITGGFLIRIAVFLKNSYNLNESCKEKLTKFTIDLSLLLETYVTACFSGLILLPFAVFALKMGTPARVDIFYKVLALDLPIIQIFAIVFSYVLLAVGIYWITYKWADMLYGKYLKELKDNLETLKDEV